MLSRSLAPQIASPRSFGHLSFEFVSLGFLRPCRATAHIANAVANTVLADLERCVSIGVWVSSRAVCFAPPMPARHVRCVRHWLKMGGVHASRITAEVIKLHRFGNWADGKNIRINMGHKVGPRSVRSAAHSEIPISIGVGFPRPTSFVAARPIYLRPESIPSLQNIVFRDVFHGRNYSEMGV